MQASGDGRVGTVARFLLPYQRNAGCPFAFPTDIWLYSWKKVLQYF